MLNGLCLRRPPRMGRPLSPLVALLCLLVVTHAGASDVDRDGRDDLQASLYAGISIDSFAASDLTNYLNPNASGEITERGVAGFDISYRLTGTKTSKTQFWVYGQTVYGVRSSDVDCEKNPTIAVCSDFNSANPSAGTLYMLRNASSLEAFLGFRWEFYHLQKEGTTPASVYLGAQAGFLTVTGGGDDLVDMNHLAIGALVTNGRFQDSFLEFGFGKTDLFVPDSRHRWKMDGMLTWLLRDSEKGLNVGFFAEMTVDADFGNGADSVQTYLGFTFDVDALVPKAKGDKNKASDAASGEHSNH